ncbi:MAG: hypothetical protein E7554_08175, partial [Ruminococcaceae bacterium]|nr:hypothetical protein [Oscillospiraceae bacterium]
MWFAILGTALLFTVVGMIYLVSRFSKFGIVRKIAGERRWLRVLLGIVPMLGFVVYGCFDTINMVVVLLHLAIFWLIADILCGIVSRIRRHRGETADADDGEQTGFRVYRRGVAVIALCAVYLTVGWFNAHNV